MHVALAMKDCPHPENCVLVGIPNTVLQPCLQLHYKNLRIQLQSFGITHFIQHGLRHVCNHLKIKEQSIKVGCATLHYACAVSLVYQQGELYIASYPGILSPLPSRAPGYEARGTPTLYFSRIVWWQLNLVYMVRVSHARCKMSVNWFRSLTITFQVLNHAIIMGYIQQQCRYIQSVCTKIKSYTHL